MSLNGYYKLRYEVLERDNFTCQLCGQRAPNVQLEVDHIKPLSENGTDDMSNLRSTCFSCNRGRGSFTVQSHKVKNDAANIQTNKHIKTLSLDEHIYRFLMRWNTAYDIGCLMGIFQGKARHELEAALARLHERGLAYRNDAREWFAVDKYSLEYKKR